MKSKAIFLSFLLCLMGGALALSSTSCKGKVDGGGTQLNITSIKLWEKDVLDANKVAKEKLTVSPLATSKSLVIAIENCTDFKVVATVNNKNYEGSTASGLATIAINDKLPTTDTPLAIVITADGFAKKAINTNVKMEETSVPELSVKLTPQGDPAIEIDSEGQEVEITKTSATLTVSSPRVEMEKLTIDGKDVTLTNKNQYTHQIPNITADKSVTVLITYALLKDVNRSFNIKKYTDADLPLTLVSAKIFSGDNNKEKTVLGFKEGDKESVTMTLDKNIRHSVVTLEMEFNQEVVSRTVKCTDQRPENYNKEFFTPEGISGTFSGYLIADIDDKGVEKQIDACKDKKYTELLIVGYGTVSYEIEVKAKNGKTLTRTVEIINPAKTVSADGKTIEKKHFQQVFPMEGHSQRELLYWLNGKVLNNVFALPFYFKGPVFTDNNLNPNGFEDLAYMENVSLDFIALTDKPIYFYYNVFSDGTSGKAEDKHEFKRIKGKVHQGKTQKFSSLKAEIKDVLDGKYLDCFISGEKSLPNPMCPLMYGKKFTKAKNIKHGWLLQVENNMPVKLTEKSEPSATEVFLSIFNYRLQMKAYEEQNDTNNSETKYLTIAKDQKYTFFSSGKEENGWTPFLSGAKGDDRDIFVFRPLFDKSLISEVKYTLKKGKTKEACTEVDGHKNEKALMLQTKNGMPFIIIAAKKGSDNKPVFFDFEKVDTAGSEIYIYLVELTVTYTNDETDKFNFMIDYKNQHTLESKDVGYDSGDADLFGVPTHYGVVKELSPARMHSVVDYSLADCTLVE